MNTIVKNLRPSILSRDAFFRNALLSQLAKLKDVRIEITDCESTRIVGLGSPELEVKLRVLEQSFYRKVALGGSIAAAESYIQGDWYADDLTKLVRAFARNRDLLDKMEGGLASLANWILRIPHWFNRNSVQGSRKNIAAHYDLGNDFFEMFLDKHGMYSSATYLSPKTSIDQASTEKLDRICRKLKLSEADSIVEIGTGWGGFACYAAAEYGCKVTTATISREQYEAARARVKKAGLEHRVTVLFEDYRRLEGRYDKLVSIEMIEAVGHQYLDTYFAKCSSLLKPDGLALIQAITIEDYRYEKSLRSVDFIKRYIFPGSFIPSVSAIVNSTAKQTDLRLINLEDQGDSYAWTIRAWRERFESNLSKIKGMGYSEQFIRMWRFYLAYCEGGFMEKTISNAQLLFAKPRNTSDQWLAR
ncbi:MAG: cyclopropane-fatty-acyl-phospholipid synthase family protein [Arenicellales bacterium]|nr:cyclopropane-fatty-acyl-phospholipid synthase family protein [Arenicellales bacterium]